MFSFGKKIDPDLISDTEGLEKKFCELKESGIDSPYLTKIKNYILNLLKVENSNNNVSNDSNSIDSKSSPIKPINKYRLEVLQVLPIIEQMDKRKYIEFYNRMNEFLENNEKLSEGDFYQLFGNSKKNKSIGNYYKSDFHQGGTGECVLISSLEILKKTPFFETMIRCSLKRNNTNDGRILLVPLCNKNGQFKEIKDTEIKYLQNPYFVNGRGVISESSLGFNILESIFIKDYLLSKLNFNEINELDYDTIDKKIKGFLISGNILDSHLDGGVLDYFLGNDVINLSKDRLYCDDFSKECLEYILELSKSRIIKFGFRIKIPRGYKYSDKPKKSVNSTRGYMVDIYGENDKFLYGIDEGGRHCFSPKGCDEWFITGHQYSIEKTFTKNGETYVVVINPRFTEKKLLISIDQFMEMVSNFDVVCFNIDKLFVDGDKSEEIK